MKRSWIKKVAALVIFIVTVLLLDLILNRDNVEVTTEMSKATLPVISTVVEGYKVNNMQGYRAKREEAFTKDSITPVTENREITFAIDDYGTKVEGISYEVRSADGERLIERGEVKQLNKTEEEAGFTIQLKDLIDQNEEYVFVTILTLNGGEKAYYYARFIENEEYFTKEKLDYVHYFHNITLGSGKSEEIQKYLESNSMGDNTTFHKVTINSSLKQVVWDGLNVKKEGEAAVYIKDINKDTASIIFKYLVSMQDSGRERFAFVEEYYRIRYGTTRMYLLDYKRTTEEIFTGKKEEFNTDKIILGINNDKIDMEESEGGSNLAFINGNRLFSYNTVDNKLVEVFSFYNKDNFDFRTMNENFKIDILNMEDNGNITFSVSGYMNRGRHEGEVGIVIYYYHNRQNSIEEQIFIPYEKSADILMKELEDLLYMNMEQHVFFILDGTLYDINIQEKNYTILLSDMKREDYKIAPTGRMVCLGNKKENNFSNMAKWYNLSHGTVLEIKAGYDEYIKVLGFMEEDLVYGVAKKADVKIEENGNIIFPSHEVVIVDEEGEGLKKYHKEGYFVTDASIEENQISLKRIFREDNGQYEVAPDDHIASNNEAEKHINVAGSVTQDKYKKVAQIIMKNTIDLSSMKNMSPKEVIFEGGRELMLEHGEEKRYYTYGADGVELITDSSAEAIQRAYDVAGSVVDEKGNYIWKKGTSLTKNQIMAITGSKEDEERGKLAVCLDTILELEGISRKTQAELDQKKDAVTILQSHLREEKILNLKGCPLETILYYLDRDIPVLAFAGEDIYLITGFNTQNVVLMDPESGTVYKKGMNDATALFEAYGNQFITYIR